MTRYTSYTEKLTKHDKNKYVLKNVQVLNYSLSLRLLAQVLHKQNQIA